MKKYILITIILISNLYSQSNSIYSNFGVGELNINPTARRNGFGLGVAIADNYDINPFNIASTSKIQFVKFIASLNYSINNYADVYSKNSMYSASFENLLIAIPILRDYGVVLSGGVNPFSKVKYKVSTPDIYFDSVSYQSIYETIGGLYNYFLGISYEAKKIGSFGISTNFLIGTIHRRVSTEIIGALNNPSFSKQYQFKGNTFRIGYISDNLKNYVSKIPIKDLRIGFSYLFPVNLERKFLYTKQGIFIDTVSQSSDKYGLPSQLIVGVSLKFSNRLNLSVDYLNQNWTKLNANELSNYTLIDQNLFSIGFEYLPVSRPERFIDALTFRIGLFSKNIGISISGQKINEFGVKTGISLPIDQLNLIDFGFQYSIRGKKENNLIRESIFNFSLGINFAEIWFVRNEE